MERPHADQPRNPVTPAGATAPTRATFEGLAHLSALGHRQFRPICHGDVLPTAQCRGHVLPEFVSRGPARLGMVKACLNGSLPLPTDIFTANAMDPFTEMVKHCPSCFIGHFTQAEIWRARGYPVTIIELQPRPGDIHWNDSKPALRQAEIVFITGLTLINDTFLEVVSRTPQAKYRVLLGPTVPCNPLFFDYGVHLIGSTLISDVDLAIRYCQHGGTSVRHAPPGALRRISLTNRPELKMEFDRATKQPASKRA